MKFKVAVVVQVVVTLLDVHAEQCYFDCCWWLAFVVLAARYV
jgi:hypothetical protein